MEIRRLRDLREDHDKSQKAIAEYLNMHRSVYRRYESGERETPAWVLFCGGFAAGIFLAQYLLPGGWLLSGGLVCLALGFGALLLPECWRKRAILCLVGAALALGWNWLYVRQVSEPMEALADTQQALTMTLTEYPTETRFGAKVTVRAEGLPGIRLFCSFLPVSASPTRCICKARPASGMTM